MATTQTGIAIIGSGFSGICMGIQLKKAGITDFVIFERAADIGGTWRDNTYPGVACDVSSHMYSFSFEPNPNWSRMFSPQAEILQYLKDCVKKYELTPFIKYNTNISGAEFDEKNSQWNIHTQSGETIIAKTFVNGMGPLNRAVVPHLKGIETFTGKAFHSSEWDHSFDLTNKRVAVIGTGASAIQIVPNIVKKVKALYLFQRTAPWVLPKPDRNMSTFEKKMFNALPFTQKLYRYFIYWVLESTALGLVVNPKWTKFLEKISLKHLKKSVADEELRKKLTPKYMLGCKRILISNDYYKALTLQQSQLITEGIEKVEGNAIITKDGKRSEVDAIIYGTGFNAADYPKEFVVKGLNGKLLADEWKHGPEAYLGISVKHFPNLFFIIGPNTGLGNNSMIFMIESQVNYIVQCIKTLRGSNYRYLDVKENIQENYNFEIQKKLAHTVWNSGCVSWYQTSEGKNTSIWPGFTFQYWKRMKNLKREDFKWVK
jgi:cation diffusion facilitator CzcD-associated flavoprotein CzcO